ncbi:hypothetical protein EON83_02990 [bacterium]|nr:MAG: hypothetical protein EON83_02990 [bacterium]
MSLRVVVLSQETPYGMRLLRALKERGIVPDALVVYAGLDINDCFHSPKGRKRLREAPRALVRWQWRRLRFRLKRKPIYTPYARQIIPSGSLGSARIVRDLQRLQPDILVLGASHIISQDIIDTARLGVLNSHPGVLPWVRGLGSAGRSLMAGVPIGASCHLVDSRIDTGAVIERRLLPIEVPTLLGQLEKENSQLTANLLADVVARTVALGALPESTRQETRFPLGHRETPEERQAFSQLAQTGRPRELFELWNPLCLNHDTWALPSQSFTPPQPPNLTPLDVTW